MRRFIPVSIAPQAVLAVLLAACAWWGCAKNPSAPDGATRSFTADNPPPALQSARNPGFGSSPTQEWQEVIRDEIKRGEDRTASGGRYKMHFFAGSLQRDIEFVLSALPGTVRFELEPHGELFKVPVELTIDYKGTNADPESSNYDGSLPLLYTYNELIGVWEPVPGLIDTKDCKYTARLPHFSSYILGGRAGW